MKETIEINFDVIKEIRNKSLVLNHDKTSYFILNKIKSNVIEHKSFSNCEYYSQILFSNNYYEGISFSSNINENIIINFFNIISSNDEKIPNSISEIKSIFQKSSKIFTPMMKRGLFSELYCLYNSSNLKSKNNYNSTYDMEDEEGNDVEIKSYSTLKKEIDFSLKQLTVNLNAKVIIIPVDESSKDGITIYDAYKQLSIINKERYEWIEENKEEFHKDKYIVNPNKILNIKIDDISKHFIFPDILKNANFIVDINKLEK